jgi:chromosome segregation ATPase
MRCVVSARSRVMAPVVFASVGLVLAALATVGAASQTTPTTDPMNALLAEVHALRLAMEQAASVAPRVQLTLARLNIEEQRITQLASQLDQVRRELSAAALESKRTADQLLDTERSLQAVPDDKTRRQVEYEIVEIKRMQARQSAIEQQARTREADAQQLLSTEQSRWIDLNARLDELERLLGPIRQ